MTTLVTGGAGHLGANLVRALLDGGRRVRVLVHDDTRALEGLDVERVRGDVLAPDTLAPALRGVDVVHHLAGLISIRGDPHARVAAINADGVRNVGRAALEAGVRRFVHVSSVHAFQPTHEDAPITEASARAAADQPAYARSKWAGEQALAALVAQGLPALTLLPSGVLGPFDFKPSLMGRFFLELYARRVPALVDGAFDWVDARDVARTAIRAESAGAVGESYLVTGTDASVVALARLAEDATGVPAPRFTAPMWLARAGAKLLDAASAVTGVDTLWTSEALVTLRSGHRFDCAKARAALAHEVRPLRDTVRDTYAWFASTGALAKAAA